MFFSWFAKNRHFKKGHNLSGQIMPFLLVIIAIFLGAMVATMQIGKSALNMTCTDNAADACSLAAASAWALALNGLTLIDNVLLRKAYSTYYTKLKQLLSLSNSKLSEAQRYINLAKPIIIMANIQAGLVPLSSNCTIWYHASTAYSLLNTASRLLKMAATAFSSAKIYNNTMKMATEAMKMEQSNNLTKIMNDMKRNSKVAAEQGKYYAQTYNCQTEYPTVTVPDIISYELEVAKMNNPCPTNDPYNLKAFELFATKLDKIADEFSVGSQIERAIYQGSIRGKSYCDTALAYLTSIPPRPDLALYYYGLATAVYAERRVAAFSAAAAITIYTLWANKLISGSPTVKDLIKRNKKISEALGAAGGLGAGRIVSVGPGSDKVGKTLLIIGINRVIFDKGCVFCTVGGSQSSAAFSDSRGGNMDPRYPLNITVGYTPRLASSDNSCPKSGVSTTGSSGVTGNTSDAGCGGGTGTGTGSGGGGGGGGGAW